MAVVGWIGLGNMGGPMTANMVKGGHILQGFDLNQKALDAAAERGVTPVTSIAEAVAGADVVFTMLPRGEHALAVYSGDKGVFASADTKTLLISLAASAEGAVLAERLGPDKQVFWDIASVSSGDSWALGTWYPVAGIVPTAASNNNFAPTFTAELAHKDVGLAMAAAQSTTTSEGRTTS